MNNSQLDIQWLAQIDALSASAIVELVNCTTADGGTLGFAQTMNQETARSFIGELERRLKNGEAHVLLGREQGLPAFLAVLTPSGMPNCRHRAEISKGVVHPKFRGKHLVAHAFRALVEKAVALGIEQFVLDVREGTPAHKLWQLFGFTTYGILEDYARVGGVIYQGHFMSQSVNAMRMRLFATQPFTQEAKEPLMLDKTDFKQELRTVLEKNLTLSHPIFIPLLNGTQPNPDLLKRVTLQGYQLTKYFLEYVEHLFFYCPLPKFKRALLINVYEEETGRLSKTDNHVVLMQNFIRALGITDAERDRMQALPATQELIEYRLRAVKDPARYHIGAAAVMIASEGQNLEVRAGEARHELLGKVYGLTESDLLFFSVHQKEDVGHVEQGLSLVTELCTTATMQQEALEAVDHTCRLFYAMYENMYKVYCGGQTPDLVEAA